MKKHLVLVALILFTNCKSWSATEDTEQAFATVISAKTYSWGWVGTPAHPSEAELATRQIYKLSPDSQIYQNVNKASNEGKMYLLCVLKRKNKALYAKASKDLKNSDSKVSIFNGNVLQITSMKEVINQIEVYNCDPLNWPETAQPK